MHIELLEYFIPQVMEFLFGQEESAEEENRLASLKPIIPVSQNWSYRSFLNLYESLLLGQNTRESLEQKEREEREEQERLANATEKSNNESGMRP